MKMLVAMAALAVGLSASASAETLKFSNNGAKLPSSISGIDLCSDADICSKKLIFNTTTAGKLTVTGTVDGGKKGPLTGIVIQDLSPKNGGLGILKPGNAGGDNIGAGEKLTLSFDKKVEITDLIFFNADHKASFNKLAQWGLSIDGGAVVDYSLTNLFDPAKSFTGKTFTFVGLAGTKGCDTIEEAYYLSSLNISAVPEPSTYAMMIGGLGLLSLARRRRAI